MDRFALLLLLLACLALWSMRAHDPAAVAREAVRASPSPYLKFSLAPSASRDSFDSSHDLRGFVERNAARSEEPRMAYEISQALEECYAASRAIPEQPAHFDIGALRRAMPVREVSDDYRPASSHATDHWASLWARHAAEEALAAPCRGFEGHPIEPTRVLSLLHQAALAGEPRARARMLLFRDVTASKAEMLDAIPELLATGDPTVIRDVGAFLARGESYVTLGPAQVPSDVAVIAWELAVCDLGYDCGPASRLTLAQCAFGGHCGAGSYEDALASAEDPQQLAQAHLWRTEIVRALRSRDWEWLALSEPRRP